MRVIHTSDWHLGQHFFGKSRHNEHRAFLNWLLTQAQQQQVDAIIVAGDVFDTGSPPSYARQLYNQFIVDLQQHNCELLILGGNHDSVATLNESTNLLACLNTYVLPGVCQDINDQVITLKSRDGKPGAVVCAIPYIRPRDVTTSKAGQSAQDKQVALQHAIAEHYNSVYEAAKTVRDQLDKNLPIIATGHLTTIGVTKTESVRDIYIGTLEAFAASAFPPADYIALGHIHRAQKVAKTEHIRYSGSPIALSFDEIGQQKNVMMVDFEQQKLVQVEPLAVPIFQPMQMIKGNLEEIENQLQQLSNHDDKTDVWLDIEVITEDYLSDLHSRIEKMTEELPVEVLVLRRQKRNRALSAESEVNRTLNELNAFEVFDKRLALESFESDKEQQRLQRIKASFDEVVNIAEQQLSEGVES